MMGMVQSSIGTRVLDKNKRRQQQGGGSQTLSYHTSLLQIMLALSTMRGLHLEHVLATSHMLPTLNRETYHEHHD